MRRVWVLIFWCFILTNESLGNWKERFSMIQGKNLKNISFRLWKAQLLLVGNHSVMYSAKTGFSRSHSCESESSKARPLFKTPLEELWCYDHMKDICCVRQRFQGFTLRKKEWGIYPFIPLNITFGMSSAHINGLWQGSNNHSRENDHSISSGSPNSQM